jgi:RNA polymerase sigma-70 factor (ECF subfamily)
LKAQEPDAWVCFVRLYGPLLYTWCRRRGLQPHDAADAVQEVCRAVHRRIGEFRHASRGAFRSWLWTITRNKILDMHRTRGTPAVGGSGHHEAMQQVTMDQPAEEESLLTDAGDRVALMRRALELIRPCFEPTTWDAFWRSSVEGRHTADVAADLQMSLAAVRKARSRVLQRLRLVLADLGEGDE